jgi:LysM repeat protein
MDTVPSTRTLPTPSAAPGVVRTLAATGVCGASTALLASFGASTARTTHPRLDEVVSVAVLAVGVVAAALLTVGCLLLTLTAVARVAGRTLHRLERVATRLTPALLRRAVAVTITTGIGLGAVSGVATASEIDLGWEVTESASVPQEPARPTPATEGPGLGAGDAAAAVQVAAAEPAGPSSSAPGSDAAAPEAATQAAVVQGTAAEPTGAGAPDPVAAPAVSDPLATIVAPTAGPPASTATTATTATTAAAHPPVPAGPTAAATVTVRAGDTLWAIAASHLPPGSDDAAVAAAWPRWYEANRDVVGPDPDVIHPGQVLAAPDAS